MQGILLPSLSLGYVDVPKNASTSIKRYLYLLAYGREYDKHNHNGDNIHRFFKRNMGDISGAKNRFLLLRDPVKRFLSVYSNRVLHYKELSQDHLLRSEKGRAILHKALPTTPDLDTYITHFESYKHEPSLWHHTKPVFYITGGSLQGFNRIFTMEEIGQFERFIQSSCNTRLQLPRLQTGGKKIALGELSEEQLRRIYSYCEKDYEFLAGYYSKEKLWTQWEKEQK